MSEQNLNDLLDDALEDLIQDGQQEDTKEQEQEKDEKSPGKSPEKVNVPKAGASKGEPTIEEMDQFFAKMTEQLRAELPRMDPEEAQANLNESVPQIFDLMQNLLSKELLYPALSELAPKFDDWLVKNSSTLNEKDKKRYKKQIGKIRDIIEVFDNESLDDKERFEKNLDLMEQMQALGAPPEELTANSGSELRSCSIM